MTQEKYNQYVEEAIELGQDLDTIPCYQEWLEWDQMKASVRQMVRNYPDLKANPTREDFIEMQKIK